MKHFLQIYLKLLTIANSFLLNIAEHENYSTIVGIFTFISREVPCSAELSMKKVYNNFGARSGPFSYQSHSCFLSPSHLEIAYCDQNWQIHEILTLRLWQKKWIRPVRGGTPTWEAITPSVLPWFWWHFHTYFANCICGHFTEKWQSIDFQSHANREPFKTLKKK